MRLDYHTHTWLCKHADGKPEEYVAVAERYGLEEIGIADHVPWPAGYDSAVRMSPGQFPLYCEIVKKLREQSRIKVKLGLEIDWVPGRMDEVEKNLKAADFDYLLGSIHYTDDFPFDNPEVIPQWRLPGKPEKIWRRYADLMVDFVNWGKFDILAHPDYPKKFNFYPADYDYFMERMEEALQLAGEKGMALEINTSGLRRPVNEMFPSLKILKSAKKHGLLLTLGSDAHTPNDVASHFKEAVALALSAGFSEIASFEKRRPTLHPIG